MTKTVDTGTPPPAVQRAEKLKELMLSGEDIESVPVSENITESPKPKSVNPITERVTLSHELYELTLPALDVSIAEHQVAIRLPNTGFKYEPKALNSEFTIQYRSKKYTVVYLGGIFTFPGDDSWVIAFIRDKRD